MKIALLRQAPLLMLLAADNASNTLVVSAAPRVNLSENLISVPGLQIQNRQNYAQDLQISVRGIRTYVDGIPDG